MSLHQSKPVASNTDANSHIVDLIPALRAFSRTFCRDAGDADDLVQLTLLKAIANIDQFQPGTRMKSWLFTIMRNSFYTGVKIKVREAPGLMDCASSRQSTEPSQEWSLRASEVGHAIERLPAAQRQVLVLITILGASYEEAADVFKCNIGTIKSRLNRARQAILTELGETSSRSLIERTQHISRHETEDHRAFS